MTKWIALLGFLAAAVAAQAGTKYSAYVAVGSTYAYGSMGQARSSADSNQYIGCYSAATATLHYAICSARDASGDSGSCRTYDDKMIRVAEAAGSDSVIEFHWSGSTCTYINVMNDSRYAPRQP